MFSIYFNNLLVHHPNSEECFVTKCKLTEILGKAGYLEIEIPKSNPRYNQLLYFNKRFELVVKEGSYERFRGRISNVKSSIEPFLEVTAEGQLSYLNDYAAAFYRTGNTDDEKIQTNAPLLESSTLFELIEGLLNAHNQGRDASEKIYFQRPNWSDLACGGALVEPKTLKEELVENKLAQFGLYPVMRMQDKRRTLALLDTSRTYHKPQKRIRVGKNLLQLNQSVDFTGVITAIEPLQEKGDIFTGFGDETHLSGNHGDKFRIQGNYLIHKRGEQMFGFIAKKQFFKSDTSDTTLSNQGLLQLAAEELLRSVNPVRKIEVRAIDLSIADSTVDPIYVGDWVRVEAKEFDFRADMVCTRCEIDLVDPRNNIYEFGAEQPFFEESVKQKKPLIVPLDDDKFDYNAAIVTVDPSTGILSGGGSSSGSDSSTGGGSTTGGADSGSTPKPIKPNTGGSSTATDPKRYTKDGWSITEYKDGRVTGSKTITKGRLDGHLSTQENSHAAYLHYRPLTWEELKLPFSVAVDNATAERDIKILAKINVSDKNLWLPTSFETPKGIINYMPMFTVMATTESNTDWGRASDGVSKYGLTYIMTFTGRRDPLDIPETPPAPLPKPVTPSVEPEPPTPPKPQPQPEPEKPLEPIKYSESGWDITEYPDGSVMLVKSNYVMFVENKYSGDMYWFIKYGLSMPFAVDTSSYLEGAGGLTGSALVGKEEEPYPAYYLDRVTVLKSVPNMYIYDAMREGLSTWKGMTYTVTVKGKKVN